MSKRNTGVESFVYSQAEKVLANWVSSSSFELSSIGLKIAFSVLVAKKFFEELKNCTEPEKE